MQIDCTIRVVTRNINIAHGAGQHGHAVSAQAGDVRPREVLLIGDQPVVKQFLKAAPSVRSACPKRWTARKWPRSRRWSRLGRTTAASGNPWCANADPAHAGLLGRKAVKRHRARVHEVMHTLPASARRYIGSQSAM